MILKTLELEELDTVPIHFLGWERSGTTYQEFRKHKQMHPRRIGFSKRLRFTKSKIWDISLQRFLAVDCWAGDCFRKTKYPRLMPPKGYRDCTLNFHGSLHKWKRRENTGKWYNWYVGGYFRKKEQYYELWEKHGKPFAKMVNFIE